jgi:hypothetical protein
MQYMVLYKRRNGGLLAGALSTTPHSRERTQISQRAGKVFVE